MRHLGDITKINWSEVPTVDVVTGGSPCQGLSVAGKRKGLADERSGLFMEQIRCVKELRQKDERSGRSGVHVRPRYMVWENVPGAFSSGNPKGSDFAAVLEEIVKIVEPEAPAVSVPEKGWPTAGCLYDEMGRWSVAWRVHDAQFWGVSQRRKRIALIADFGGLTAPEVLFERKGLSWDPESCGETRQAAAGEVEGGAGSAVCYNIGGYYSGAWLSDNPHSGVYEANVSRTLDALNCGAPTCNQGGTAIVYCLQGTGIDRTDNAGCNGKGVQKDVCYTLNTSDRHAVVYDARGNGDGQTVCTLTGDHQNRVTDYTALCIGNGQMCNMSMKPVANTLDTMHDQQAILRGSVVRRLTPLECERLQGYPDGWTDIGDWVDSKGKRRKCSDAARYKALGNSIALPFWKVLARRIGAQYDRDITMGSLFDGIGGFPLVFEQTGAKAVWASEIEEFPMAVTKARFKV